MTSVARAFAVVLYRTTAALTLCFGVVLTYGMVGAILILDGDDTMPLILGIGAATTALILIILLKPMWPGKFVRDIKRMRAGGPGVRWVYTRREWRAANRLEVRRIGWSTFTWTFIGLIAGVAAIVAGLLFASSQVRELLSWLGGLILVVTAAGTAVVAALSSPLQACTRRRGEIDVSPLGIYRQPGGYLPFFWFTSALHDVQLSDGPPLHLRLLAVAQNSGGKEKLWTTIAVPAGREGEAGQLVELLRAEIVAYRERPGPDYGGGGGGGWPNIDISWLT